MVAKPFTVQSIMCEGLVYQTDWVTPEPGA